MELKVLPQFLRLGSATVLVAANPVVLFPRAVQGLFVAQEFVDLWRVHWQFWNSALLAVALRGNGTLDYSTAIMERGLAVDGDSLIR